MEHKAPYALTGLFVCLCIAGLIGFVVWTKGGNDKAYTFYTVLFPESVSGLEKGAQVLYRGVQVGKVEDLRLPTKDDDEVRVDIRIREDVPVRESTFGELALAGVTGVVNLNLTPPQKDNDAAPAPTLSGEPYPLIEGRPSALESAMKDVPAIAHELRAFSGKLNKNMDNFEGSFIGKLMGADGDKEKPRNTRQYQRRE